MLRFLYGNSSLEGINFSFKGEYKKAVKERYEGKGLSADAFYRLVLKSIISQRLVGFTRQEKERKNHAGCVLVIWCLTRVINGKIIEDEAIYTFSVDFWQFLVEDFFLPVIKPPGAYFNNKLLPSCRSSKFSSSFPATRILLCAPLDPVRPDRNSKSAWRQSVLIFLRQTLHWKLRRAATFLIKNSFPARFLQQQLE